jgi:hypothetical protein
MLDVLIADFLGGTIRRARLIPGDKWNWSFSERTPTAREICEHTFAWQWWDRQQIEVRDPSKYAATPTLPETQLDLLNILQDEAAQWRRAIRGLTPEQLAEERLDADGQLRNVRSLLAHAAQSVVYKQGQLCMLFYDLGLDGGKPYDAPWPNSDYGFPGAPWPSRRTR